MTEYPQQHRIGARRIFDEEPVFAVLIVDRKPMRFIRKIDPGFGDMISDEAGEHGPAQFFDMISHVIPQPRHRQPGKMPRAVVHAKVDELVCHWTYVGTIAQRQRVDASLTSVTGHSYTASEV